MLRNKIPFKEKQRHLDYQYNHPMKQEEILIKKMIKQQEKEKAAFYESERK